MYENTVPLRALCTFVSMELRTGTRQVVPCCSKRLGRPEPYEADYLLSRKLIRFQC
jgi:hypothetical protein